MNARLDTVARSLSTHQVPPPNLCGYVSLAAFFAHEVRVLRDAELLREAAKRGRGDRHCLARLLPESARYSSKMFRFGEKASFGSTSAPHHPDLLEFHKNSRVAPLLLLSLPEASAFEVTQSGQSRGFLRWVKLALTREQPPLRLQRDKTATR